MINNKNTNNTKVTHNTQVTNNSIIPKLGLIGNPISHSKSPALFAAAYSSYPFTYNLIEANTIQKAMERFFSEGFTGANVTAPFKDLVFKYITHPDRISSLLKSANIIIRKGEELHSYNSDYYGVKNTIEELIANGHPITKALVIGAGGAGKAATLALNDLGIKTFWANRTPLSYPAYIHLSQIPQYATECQLIIYTLAFKIKEMEEINLKNKIIFEANYANPQFANAESYISGKHWLYNQAIPAFKLFTGIEPNTNEMKKTIGF
ncbi:MAG: hypothetical protein RSC28_01870 [Bacteroidales bacterium]